MLRLLKTLFHKILELVRRVKAGRRPDSDGGAPVPARSQPRPPVLVGAGAKLLPPLDPEPDVRDP